MKQILCIAEKPDMAFKYAAALGGVFLEDGSEIITDILNKREEYIKRQSKKDNFFKGIAKRSALKGCEITYAWARGHLVNLYQAADYDGKYKQWSYDNYPFIPEQFKNKVINDKYVISQYNVLKKLLSQKYDYCINGTDAEKEGELIFYRIYELTNSKIPVKRLWLNSTKEEDIVKEFSSLREPNKNLLEAAKGRAYADWIYGINYTVLFSLKTNVTTPIGRVKMPTLKLLVDRYREVTNFKPQKYYEVFANAEKDGEIVKFAYPKKFMNKSQAEEFKKELEISNKGVISNIENKIEKEYPPSFYSLSKLQAEANNYFGYTLSKTLDIVQSLYDNSYVTYPRTDSTVVPVNEEANMINRINYIPDNKFKKFKDIAKNNINNKLKLNSKYVKDTSSAHFAIVINNSPGNLTDEQWNIYNLISRSVIAPFLGPATWNTSVVTLKINDIDFIAKGKVLFLKGFRELIPLKKDNVELPQFNVKEDVTVSSFEVEEKETKPKALYTDSSLVTAMANIKNVVYEKEYKEILTECKGIGTEATRAALLESLINANYVKREKKNLIPTELGIKVIDNFPVEEIKSPITTAKWEMRLNNIIDGSETLANVLKDIKADIEVNSKIIKNMQNVNWGNNRYAVIGKCPVCGGNIVEGKKGYGCSNWKEKDCKFVIWNTIAGKKISQIQAKKLLETGKTDYIEGFKSKKGNTFGAYLTLDKDNKVIFKFKDKEQNIIGKCPVCGGNIVEGKKGYGCSNWKEKDCKFVIWNTIAGKKISQIQAKKLLETGKTDYIEGFKSKKGNTFGAYLTLDKENKVIFKFKKDKEEYRTIGKCPMCGGDITESKFSYICSDCDLKINKTIADYTLTEDDIKELIKNKRTHKISNFKSQRGKAFDAALVINKDKIEFEF